MKKKAKLTEKGYSWMYVHPALLELELLVDSCSKTLELVPSLHEGGCCTSPGEERRAAAHGRASVSEPHFTVGQLGLMADSRPAFPLGSGMDQPACAEEPGDDPASGIASAVRCTSCTSP